MLDAPPAAAVVMGVVIGGTVGPVADARGSVFAVWREVDARTLTTVRGECNGGTIFAGAGRPCACVNPDEHQEGWLEYSYFRV